MKLKGGMMLEGDRILPYAPECDTASWEHEATRRDDPQGENKRSADSMILNCENLH